MSRDLRTHPGRRWPVVSLTDDERELIALWDDGSYLCGNLADRCDAACTPTHEDLPAAVEQIAQARATAAVEAFRARAVEAIHERADRRTYDWEIDTAENSIYDDAARIVRDLA